MRDDAPSKRQEGRPRRGDAKRRPDDHDQSDATRLVEAADREREAEVDRRRDDYLDLLRRAQHGQDTPHVTPWLGIPYAGSDTGLRPIPPGLPFWASPFISVESSDPLGNAVAGEANFLHAQVFNLGDFIAAPVQVDFAWADPSLGLGPGMMNAIGTEYVEIPPRSSLDVRCDTPWVPIMVNGGHECVMVNSTSYVLDPITHPFAPTLDRHVGQRNLTVVPGGAGMKLSLPLRAANVFPFPMPALIEARFVHLAVTEAGRELPPRELAAWAVCFEAGEEARTRQLVGSYARGSASHRTAQRALSLERRATEREPAYLVPVEDRRSPATVTSRLRDEVGVLASRREHRHAGDLVGGLDAFRDARDVSRIGHGVTLQELDLDAFTYRMLDLEVSIGFDVRPGEIVVVHVAQQAGPLTAGGYSVGIVIE